MSRAAYLLMALALIGCDEKRMGRSPEKKKPPPPPYESHYAEVPGVHLPVVRMNAGEHLHLPLDGGVVMARWDDSVLEVKNFDGGVDIRAVRAGAALIEGKDERGVVVQLPVQVFPPIK